MLVLIIHLARATHRKTHACSLKQRLETYPDMEVRLHDAVDGKTLPRSDWNRHIKPALLCPTYPFSLNPGEVGCFLSHRSAWQAFLKSDHESCLILEDDADIDDKTFVVTLKNLKRNFSYMQLPPRKPRNWPQDSAQFQPCILHPPSLGTAAQILSRHAAESLLSCSQKFDRPIDTFLQMTWHHKVEIQTIYPSMIRLANDRIAQTTIQKKTNKSLLNELKRSWKRMSYRYKIRRLSRAYSGFQEP